ncbi:MAG: FMN-binding protein [Lachnospiraceae bacterium]|nr:FMN-binding protein [Lachnospiraceae bacterium]
MDAGQRNIVGENMNKIKKMIFLIPSVLCLLAVIVGVRKNIPDLQYPELPKLHAEVMGQEAATQNKQRRKVKANKKRVSTPKIKNEIFTENGKYKDGVYYGEAKGYGGIIKVLVTIKSEKIDCIEVTDHSSETESYYKTAEKIIPRILKAQSPNVDTVSGATYSSNGIKNAVISALNKASGKANATVYKEKNKFKERKKKAKPLKRGTPADGTFEGEAACEKFGYTVKLKVKFLKGKAVAITDLELIDNEDSENVPYCQKAWKPTIKKILKKQNADVDSVSGATYSSNAIKDAFVDALNKAIEANGGPVKNKPVKTEPETNESESFIENEEIETESAIKDGTYTVTVVCAPDDNEEFSAYHLTGEVTFYNGKLISISNISSDAESNKKYYQWAANGRNGSKGVIDQLIEKQSVNGLSAVSGATCSSVALKNIFVNAIKMAQGCDETVSNAEETSETEIPTVEETTQREESGESGKKQVIQTSAWVYAMEDEYGDYDFDDYELFANVIFENDAVADIQIISCGGESNRFYCEKAVKGTNKEEGMLGKILRVGVDEADAVSGATCTSEALKTIYNKALKMYKELIKNDENVYGEND